DGPVQLRLVEPKHMKAGESIVEAGKSEAQMTIVIDAGAPAGKLPVTLEASGEQVHEPIKWDYEVEKAEDAPLRKPPGYDGADVVTDVTGRKWYKTLSKSFDGKKVDFVLIPQQKRDGDLPSYSLMQTKVSNAVYAATGNGGPTNDLP